MNFSNELQHLKLIRKYTAENEEEEKLENGVIVTNVTENNNEKKE